VSITVTVNGQSGPNVTATNGDTIAVTVSPSAAPGATGPTGPAGPSNSLAIGTVTTGTAAATITGTAPTQTLNLVLPAGATGSQGPQGGVGATGPAGPANSLAIGSVSSGSSASATITGSSPSQTLNLVLPVGATGATGATGPQGPAGSVNLADETPQPLGTASAGTALSAARADHVHAQGSIAYSGLSGIPSTFAPSAHFHAVSDVTGLQTALDSKQAAGTYATLVGGTVPSAQLPSYVDDVVEYANLAAFTEQSTGKIYVARDTGKIYRWSGSAYVEISPSPGSTDSVTEGSTNLYYTNARASAAAPVQSVAGRTGTVTLAKSDVGLGNVDNTADASKPVSTAQAAADAVVQAYAIQRANHTGAQAISTVTGLQTSLDGKAATSHTHSLSDISQSSATTGQVPTWNGSAWAAATPSGGGGSYTLPTATSSVLGGVKVGSCLTITDGVLAATGGGGSGLTWSSVPASASATGTAGQIAYDANFEYTCVAASTWIRTPLPTWNRDADFVYFGGTFTSASYSAGPTHGRGSTAFLGGVTLANGNVALVPYNSSTIGIYNPTANTYTNGPTHGVSSPAFAGGALAANGKVIFAPNSSVIGIYDPVANTYANGPTHGQGDSAFYGAVTIPDGKIALIPHKSAYIGIYDCFANTYTNGPAHGRGDAAFVGCCTLVSGKVVLAPFASTVIGIYDPVANTYANGPTHGQGASAFDGCVQMPSGKVCLVPNYSANIGIYDPLTNTYTSGPTHGQGTNAFAGGVLLPSGKVLLVPYGASYVGIYDPVANTYTNGPSATGFFGGMLLPSGKAALIPLAASSVGLVTPSPLTATTSDIATGQYLNKF